MALIDKASLLMVPSTYEAGKLYNVLPSGNRAPDSTDQNSGYDQTRADFDFDRGSNAAATRIGSDGLIKKYRENLLTQSNNFSDSDWGKGSSITLTSGQSGYDGTNDAWLLSKGSIQFPSLGQFVSNSGVKTLSVYAKANVTSNLCLFVSSSPSNFYQDFDLSNGTLGAGSNGVIATNIDSLGNGWYRCSVVFNGATTSADIFPDTISGANAGSIYIQDAQLESGLVASSYLDSTSVTGKAGVLVDLPRINYDANGENGSLLLEPSRQNLITYSELLDDTYYSNIQSSVTNNNATSPEGVQNAALLKNIIGNGVASYIRDLTAGMATSTTYTTSIYAKYVNCQYIFIRNLGVANQPEGYFDIQNGVVALQETGLTGDIEPIGTDGWYRCSITGTTASSISVNYIDIGLANDDDGTRTSNLNQSALLYGLQNELGSYSSSYIPTMGTSETRAADSCSVTGASDVIGQTEGTLFAEFDFQKLITGDTGRIICIGDNTISNRIGVGIGGNGKFEGFVVSSGTLVAYIQTADVVTELKNYKIAMAYKANDFALYINGVQIGTDNGGAVPTGMDKVFVGLFEIGGSGSQPSNPIKQATLFNERLSNEELATLTTL